MLFNAFVFILFCLITLTSLNEPKMREVNPASGSLPHFCGSNVRFLWGLTSSCEQNRKIFVGKKPTGFFSESESGMWRELCCSHSHCVTLATLKYTWYSIALCRLTALGFSNLSIILTVFWETTARKFGLLLNEVSFVRSHPRKLSRKHKI